MTSRLSSKTKIYCLILISFFSSLVLVSKTLAAGSECEYYLKLRPALNQHVLSTDESVIQALAPYSLGDETTDSQHLLKAKFIRLALKMAFPKLNIKINVKALPKKFDFIALLNFFETNQKAIDHIFQNYENGILTITDHTSIANFNHLGVNSLDLSFRVTNEFGSAFFHPLANSRPLDREHLKYQWQIFASGMTRLGPDVIK